MGPAVVSGIGLAAAAGAVLVLRRAWRRPIKGAAQGGLILAGWLLALVALGLLVVSEGFDRGAAIAVCVIGVVAYVAIAAGVEVRKPRKLREAAPAAEPLDPRPRPMRIARATARFLITVVLASTAALALALAWSLHGPGAAVDRVVVAAFVLPVVWGAAMSWALADDRLLRPTLGLAAATAAGLLVAYLPGAA